MPGIILDSYGVKYSSIKTHTSRDVEIINEQCDTLFYQQDVAYSNSLGPQFESEFQGSPNPFYNCHGLTFACKRTCILDDAEVWKIIKSEYIEIKVHKDVIVGDVILYFYGQDESFILHSGIVVAVNKGIGLDFKIYSKVKKGREIVHQYNKGPYYKGHIKFYRIDYADRIKTN